MSMKNRSVPPSRRAGWTAALALLAAPGLALAQAEPAPPPPKGALAVETMESGFVVVPDFRYTQVDDEFGSLAGLKAGFLTDDRLLIGGAGYWLANGSRSRELAYGGLVVEWSLARSRRVGVSFGGLVGGGYSTLAVEATGFPRGRFPGHRWRSPDTGTPTTFLVGVREGFFIAEPQVERLAPAHSLASAGRGGELSPDRRDGPARQPSAGRRGKRVAPGRHVLSGAPGHLRRADAT